MSEDQLTIEAVQVRRAPGFDASGFSVEELSEGVNIIHGPNGSGKSTLARSIHGVLWPESVDERYSLLGQFTIGDEDWRLDRDGTGVRFQRNGTDANQPGLPSPSQRNRYYLSLHNLLQDNTRNESFAKQIQQESIGGYDLDIAHKALSFGETPSTRNIGEYRAAESAREDWRQAKSQAEELKQDEARLGALKSQLRDAKAASREVEVCSRAIAYHEAKAELGEAEAELDRFPSVLGEATGEEVDRVAALDKEINSEQTTLCEASDARDKAESALDSIGLSEGGLPVREITALKARLDRLKSLETNRDRLESQLREAKARRKAALEDTPLEADRDFSTFKPAAWEDIAEFGETAAAVRENQQAEAAVERWLGPSESDAEEGTPDQSTLQRGTQTLEEWLTTKDGAELEPLTERAGMRVGIVGAIAVIAASVVAGPPSTITTIVVVLLIAIGVGSVGYLASRPDDGDGRQQSYEESFAHTELEPPESWTPEAVRDRLNELYEAIADARFEAKRAERRDALLPDKNQLEATTANLETQRESLKEEYELTIKRTDVELLAITRGLIRWQEADAEVRGRETRIRWVAHLIEKERDAIETGLEPYGYGSVPDAATAQGHIRGLEDRASDHAEATRDRSQATERIRTAIDRIETLARNRRSVYQKLSLKDGEFGELQSLCEDVEAFDEAQSEIGKQERMVEERRKDLETHGKFDDTLLTTPIEQLRTCKEHAAETASSQETLSDRITAIETRIGEAKSRYDLEPKLNKYKQALDALEERRESDMEAMVGHVLVDHLQDVTHASSRPAVFDRARETLIQITKGRYELEVDGGSFRVFDTVVERGYGLDELSSGSRLQVLLAVRIAYVEQQEQDLKLPLLLDETLANSDDDRATVIIESVLELARAGRQVFYFTAQGDEVAKWEQALQTVEVEHTVVDLAAVRDLRRSVELPDFTDAMPSKQSLPNPMTHDHATYGEAIGVPPLDPRHGAGSTHLWYLVEDLDVLHRLLGFGVKQWGQLKTLLRRVDVGHLIDDEKLLRQVEQNGAALEEFVSCWQIGRGKQVDRPALEETPAVTSNFIDEVSALAKSENGNAQAIIEALQASKVSGFRRAKIEELEHFFEAQGYIENREPLDARTILIRVIGQLQSKGIEESVAMDRVETLFGRLKLESEQQAVI